MIHVVDMNESYNTGARWDVAKCGVLEGDVARHGGSVNTF